MRAVLTLALVAAVPALAEPLDTRGYFTGCDAEGNPIYCYVTAQGVNFLVSSDGGAPADVFAALEALPVASAISLQGTYDFVGDVTAEAVLTGFAPVGDDPHEATLKAMQGAWTPEGEANPRRIEILGLDWIEFLQDELTDSYMMSPGPICAHGADPGGGMAITLYRYGDDPEDDGCWLVEEAQGGTLRLRDMKDQQGQVTLTRFVE